MTDRHVSLNPDMRYILSSFGRMRIDICMDISRRSEGDTMTYSGYFSSFSKGKNLSIISCSVITPSPFLSN